MKCSPIIFNRKFLTTSFSVIFASCNFQILGQDYIKSHLIKSASSGRIPHAQLFIGPEGSGTLSTAIAYAQYILCNNTGNENENGNDSCNLKFQNISHPDLHFIYPTVTTEDVKTKPKSLDFIQDWRIFIQEMPYGGLFDWYKILGVQNKQEKSGLKMLRKF